MIKEVYYIYSVYSHNVPWDYGTTQTKCIYMVKRRPLYIHVDTMSQGIEPNRQSFIQGLGLGLIPFVMVRCLLCEYCPLMALKYIYIVKKSL